MKACLCCFSSNIIVCVSFIHHSVTFLTFIPTSFVIPSIIQSSLGLENPHINTERIHMVNGNFNEQTHPPRHDVILGELLAMYIVRVFRFHVIEHHGGHCDAKLTSFVIDASPLNPTVTSSLSGHNILHSKDQCEQSGSGNSEVSVRVGVRWYQIEVVKYKEFLLFLTERKLILGIKFSMITTQMAVQLGKAQASSATGSTPEL